MRNIKTFENFNDIHSICKEYRITNYTINPDGSIDVDGDVNLFNKGLTKIPLKFRNVSGDFSCSYNQLTLLEGCPNEVGDYFNCSSNNLTSLEGCPSNVGGNFYCDNNKIESLESCPKRVGGDFSCRNNDIWTFEWFDTRIGGNFYCGGNPIRKVWELFWNKHKLELFNEIDAIRPGRIIIMDRLNEFLIMIGKEPVQKIEGYACI